MRRTHAARLLPVLALALLAMGCAGGPPAAQQQAPAAQKAPAAQAPIVWREALFSPRPEPSTVPDEWLAKEVETRTNGQFKIQLGYAEVYGKATEIPDVVKAGTAEMGQLCSRYYPGKIPLLTVVQNPFFGAPDMDVQGQVDLALFKHPAIQQELKQWNAMGLFANPFTSAQLIGKKRLATAEDFKGQRVSVATEMGKPLEAYGAVLLSLPGPEFYTSLDKNLVDHIATSPNGFVANKLHEVSKYVTDNISLGYQLCFRIVNLDAWNKLPPDVQKLMLELAPQAQKLGAEAIAKGDTQALDVLRKANVEIIDFPAAERAKLVAKAETYWKAWVDDKRQKGLPGQEVMDFYQAKAKEFSKK